MYARRARGGSRGGFRGAGNVKKSFSKKRPSPDDEDDESARVEPASKRTKTDIEDEPLVLQLRLDDDENPFVALKANGTRRVTISDFKDKTLISIREYYKDGDGNMKPGKKGISLSIDQYNALLSAAPLVESVLTKREETTVRPNYDSEVAGGVNPEEHDKQEQEESVGGEN